MKPVHEKGVVLLSGGMDSCVLAAFARRETEKLLFLHVNYGQRTVDRELIAFKDIAGYYGVKETLVVDIGYLREMGGSCLTDPDMDVPLDRLGDEGIPLSYVPFRNGNFLSIATSWAEVRGASAVYIGAIEADSSGYPDCRKSFIESFGRAVDLGTKPDTNISIRAPFVELLKKDIVILGDSLQAPFHLTWSCYSDEEIACGRCDSCHLRLRAFEEAGVKDPIPYREKA